MSSIQYMVTVIRNNKNLLRKHTNLFKREVADSNGMYGELVDHKTITPVQLKRLRKRLQESEKIRMVKVITLFGGIMFLIISAIVYLLFYY